MRTHKWGAPAVGVSARLPQELAAQMDLDCEKFGATRTDILRYLLGEHYGVSMPNPFQPPAAEQLDMDDAPGAAGTKPRKTTRAA